MKSLSIIQKAAKVGKVICKIVCICCIVGICACVLSIPALFFGDEMLKLGGMTLHDIFLSSGTSVGTVISSIVCGVIGCTCELVLFKRLHKYFCDELEDGTPFTSGGADTLLKLGISFIWMPIAASFLAKILCEIVTSFYEDAVSVSLDNGDSVVLGVALIAISLLVRCAAEQIGEKSEKTDE